jgi:hypothetical protein
MSREHCWNDNDKKKTWKKYISDENENYFMNKHLWPETKQSSCRGVD